VTTGNIYSWEDITLAGNARAAMGIWMISCKEFIIIKVGSTCLSMNDRSKKISRMVMFIDNFVVSKDYSMF
jgi:hypothetical protein